WGVLPSICRLSAAACSALYFAPVANVVASLSFLLRTLDGALALAADDVEELVLAPVHVHLDVLVQRPDLTELHEEGGKALGPNAVDEGQELLALAPVLQVVVDDLAH